MRRPLLVTLLGVLLGVASCSPEPSVRADESARAVEQASALPVRFGVFGDSVALTLGPSVETATQQLVRGGRPAATFVPQFTVMGFGLTADLASPDAEVPRTRPFEGWQDDFADYLDRSRVDVLVVSLGHWDAVARAYGDTVLAPGDPGWRRAYTHRTESFLRRVREAGVSVVWVPYPCGPDPEVERHVAPVSAVWAAAGPTVLGDDFRVVDLDPFVCPGGHVRDSALDRGGRAIRFREPDGLHFAFWNAHVVLGPWLRGRFEPLVSGS